MWRIAHVRLVGGSQLGEDVGSMSDPIPAPRRDYPPLEYDRSYGRWHMIATITAPVVILLITGAFALSWGSL